MRIQTWLALTFGGFLLGIVLISGLAYFAMNDLAERMLIKVLICPGISRRWNRHDEFIRHPGPAIISTRLATSSKVSGQKSRLSRR